jgi:hypothetical protein
MFCTHPPSPFRHARAFVISIWCNRHGLRCPESPPSLVLDQCGLTTVLGVLRDLQAQCSWTKKTKE